MLLLCDKIFSTLFSDLYSFGKLLEEFLGAMLRYIVRLEESVRTYKEQE